MCTVNDPVSDGRLRCAECLQHMSRAVGWESRPTAHEASIISRRWVAYQFCCRSERQTVRCVENNVSLHIILTFAIRKGRGVRSE